MLDETEHLDNLVRHIGLVRDACLLLGKRLMKRGKTEFGRLLIARGHDHDATKFYGIEWDYLHAGNGTPKEQLDLAIIQHRKTNDHHPEYWGGFENMPELCVAEMVCDWYARAQEFGSGFRNWIEEEAIEKFNIDIDGERYGWVKNFVDILIEDHFVREPEESIDEEIAEDEENDDEKKPRRRRKTDKENAKDKKAN